MARNQSSEAGKLAHTYFGSTIEYLAELETDPRIFPSMKAQIQKLQLELKFLKTVFWCVAGANMDVTFRFERRVSVPLEFIDSRSLLETAAAKALQGADSENWDRLVSKLLRKVQEFKPVLKDDCLGLLDFSPQCSSCDCYEVFEFLESIVENLNYLVSLLSLNNPVCSSFDHMNLSMKQQIVILERKLKMFRNFYDFHTKPCINHEDFKDFNNQIQSWTWNTACMLLFYWLDDTESYSGRERQGEMKAKVELQMNRVLFDIIQNAKPGALEVAMYFGVLRASQSSRSNIFLVADVVNDDTEILHEGLMLLLSLLLNPPEEDSEDGNLISTQVDAIIKEAASLISSYCFPEVEEDIAKENNVLCSDFIEKVKMIQVKVKQLHLQIPNSSVLEFPKTNGLGFMDFLLRNLEEKLKCKSIPFAKHQMLAGQEGLKHRLLIVQEGLTHQLLAVQEGLKLMMSILKDTLQLQNECSATKDVFKQIINVAHQAEYVIDSSLDGDSPFWCNMIGFSNVMEEIESIATKVKKMKDDQMFNIRSVVSAERNFSQILTTKANSTSHSQVFVGFKDEEEAIIDRLTRGSMELDVVSIIGMPGIGKTTLAKKVYDSPFVQKQFYKRAWCCVSQSYQKREVLSAILKDLDTSTNKIEEKSEEDLEHLLYQSLKGRRYLIVIDDIWDIDAWKELQRPFPNDRNRSRIMLTSRILDVALQANTNSHPHFLRLFSDKECWELLTKKLFHTDDCPPYLLGVGMQIVKKCKGLPLAVTVIAGLLAKAVRDLDWWREIAKSIGSHIASMGCMDILELSYNNLPNFLKPCFLYFSAFREDQKINAKELTRLWVGERFILNPGCKSSEEVAQEYLMDLISRNLVFCISKTSAGMIRECSMHDLIHELCLRKAKEENFMELVYEVDIKARPSHSNPIRYDNYRLSIHADPESFICSNAISPCVRSLICFSRADIRFSHPINFFNNFKFLHVLHLMLNHLRVSDSFPIGLTLLVHLRCLTLEVDGDMSISPSIANLKNLETFRLRTFAFETIRLPNSIWKMRSLRLVDVKFASIIQGEDDVPEDSNQLDNVESFSNILLHVDDLEKLLRRIA